jgi:hypothetical protein
MMIWASQRFLSFRWKRMRWVRCYKSESSSNDDDESGFSRISSIRWSYCWAWAILPEILNPKLQSNLWPAGFLQSGEAAAELEQCFLRSYTLIQFVSGSPH